MQDLCLDSSNKFRYGGKYKTVCTLFMALSLEFFICRALSKFTLRLLNMLTEKLKNENAILTSKWEQVKMKFENLY